MDEQKLKVAFFRIKNDISYINSELKTIKKVNSLNSEVKKEIEEIKKFNLEKFVNNMKNELKSLNLFINDFNDKFKKNNHDVENFQKLLKNYNIEIDEIKKKLTSITNRSENNHLDFEIFEKRFQEFQELINEKVSMEISSIRLEFADGLNRISHFQNKEINVFKKKLEKINKKEKKSESKLKKVAKWLFIDDEEKNINSIKSEVKKNLKK